MNKLSFTVFFQLLQRDLLGFRREYPTKLFDTSFMFFINVVVAAYFMASEWVDPQFGPFVLVGAIASFGLIEVVGKTGKMIADIDGERTISQTLLFPLRSEWVFAYIALFWAISSMLLSIFLFPFGKILMPTRFDLGAISYTRLIPIYLSANLFYGFFALWLASIIRGIGGLNSIWMRAISPMWMFGAYFYSWHAAYKLSPLIGYVSFINPMVYIMEGMRAATLGQEGYLPYWICLIMVNVFTCLLGAHAIARLKKRLDCA